MDHRFREKNWVRIADVAGETYLARLNCEYPDHVNERCREHGFALPVSFRSERDDWIQMMVASGFGICFIPEFSPTICGVLTRVIDDPEVALKVSLVSIAGRRFSPVVADFARAIRGYKSPEAQETPG